MVRVIIRWLIIAAILVLIVFWLLGGGVGKVIQNARSFNFSFSGLLNSTSSLASFTLPFSPPAMPQIPTAYGGDNGAGSSGQYQPYQSPNSVPNGARSPYADYVVLAQSAAPAGSANAQYLEISLSPASAAVDISGWTLQSPLSGALATIPQAASPFVVGRVNTVGAARMAPGGIAYIITGPSPVGVSFSENACTGYLGTLQPFVPPLPQKCPPPSAEIPETADNVARLGASCFAYIKQLPSCTFPANPPSSLSAACKNEIQTKLSYNGCVAAHRSDAGFARNAWRLYLAYGQVLWNPQHDVIRLLDGQGRTVSVLNY